MKKSFLIGAMALVSAVAVNAQNRVNITLKGGETQTYETQSLDNISFDNNRVTVNPLSGTPTVYDGNVTGISFIKNTTGSLQITEAGGWFETAYVKWANMEGATNYHVYVKGTDDSDFTRIDYQLVRNYGNYGRADVPGLKAGQYILKVVPVMSGAAQESKAAVTGPLTVKSHDRAGFAHFNYNTGIGAYNNDGTLKSDAKVFYVTAETAKTITTDVVQGKNTVTATGFQGIIAAYQKKDLVATPLCFRIIGRISASDMDAFGSSAEGLQIKGATAYQQLNITIEGIGDDATVHGFGFLLRNAGGIELRNFAIMNCMDDCVSIDTDNNHIWVHNLDLFYGQAGGDSDQAKGDGTIDMKGDSQYITVSYNRFVDSGKSSLCGMTSESGPNWITYHHNWFDHSDSRHPRIRTMSVHIFNNYYDGVAKYGVGATSGADAFVESNYFRDCKYPILTSLQGSDTMGEGQTPNGKGTFSGESGGSIKAYGNEIRGWYFYRPYSEDNTVEFDCYEVSSPSEQVPSTIKAKSGGDTYSNFDTNPSLMYTYTADVASDVPAIVTGVYGAGRINHGDFKWTFNNAIQDKDYNVISALKTAVVNYDSWLVGFYEGATKIGNGGKGFTSTGGDAESGPEFPFGDGNAAYGQGGGTTTDPVNPGAVFIGNEDGTDYFRFNEASAEAVNAWIADGTITLSEGSSFNPTFANTDYTDLTGSIQLAKSNGVATIKCPSISTFKIQLLRTGTYKGTIAISKDGGSTWTDIHNFNEKKGVISLDLSAAAANSGETLIRVSNTSTGGLNILGLLIVKAAE